MYIYALIDLADNVFYVGQSKDPYVRLLNHISKSFLLKTEKDKILTDICKSGTFPKFKILEEIDVDLDNKKSVFNVSDRESYWINQFPHLLNLQKRKIKLKFDEIPDNSPKCAYCNEKMQKGTAKKRFCSDKCRVYANRVSKHADAIVAEMDKIAQISKKKDKPVESVPKSVVPLKSPKIAGNKSEPAEGSLAWFLKNS